MSSVIVSIPSQGNLKGLESASWSSILAHTHACRDAVTCKVSGQYRVSYKLIRNPMQPAAIALIATGDAEFDCLGLIHIVQFSGEENLWQLRSKYEDAAASLSLIDSNDWGCQAHTSAKHRTGRGQGGEQAPIRACMDTLVRYWTARTPESAAVWCSIESSLHIQDSGRLLVVRTAWAVLIDPALYGMLRRLKRGCSQSQLDRKQAGMWEQSTAMYCEVPNSWGSIRDSCLMSTMVPQS